MKGEILISESTFHIQPIQDIYEDYVLIGFMCNSEESAVISKYCRQSIDILI